MSLLIQSPEFPVVAFNTGNTTSSEEVDNIVTFQLTNSFSYIFRILVTAQSTDGRISCWNRDLACHRSALGVNSQDANNGWSLITVHPGVIATFQCDVNGATLNVIGSAGVPLIWRATIYQIRKHAF